MSGRLRVDGESTCNRCHLCETRTQVVVGRGSSDAAVFFLGEAPGRQEDRTGVGFQGQAGRRFDEILDFLGLSRDRIWLANTVRCRPTLDGQRNRAPTREEIAACRGWLEQDLTHVAPRVVVALGRIAFEAVSGMPWHASRRAVPYPLAGEGPMVFALYHPAYLIYRRDMYGPYRTDLRKLRDLIRELGVSLDEPRGPWAVDEGV